MGLERWQMWARWAIGLLPIFLVGEVFGVYSISVSSSPGAMSITTAVAGSAPTSVSNTSTTYAISTDSTGVRKIRAKLSSALPTGVSIILQLAAPAGAISAGSKTLSTSYQVYITGIPKFTTASGLAINYTLNATAAAVPASGSRTVTFSIY